MSAWYALYTRRKSAPTLKVSAHFFPTSCQDLPQNAVSSRAKRQGNKLKPSSTVHKLTKSLNQT
ncbi:MAG: hypothetical protein C0514_00340 [Candidatus Puniceispirillum sp.]|nr:hypothetical protein [Candidatus Puniceispirillum sp.]